MTHEPSKEDDHRKLYKLRGLKTRRPEPEPSPCPSGAYAEARKDEEKADERYDKKWYHHLFQIFQRHFICREHCNYADQYSEKLFLQIAELVYRSTKRLALVLQRRRYNGGRAVNSREADKDQEDYESQYDPVEALGHNSITILLNCFPLSSKSLNISKLAQAGESSTTSPGTAASFAFATALGKSNPAISHSVMSQTALPIFSAASPTSTSRFTFSFIICLK